jgi:hypothetical protein
MAKLAGLTRAEFDDRTVWKNLLNTVQEKQGKGDAFPMDEARKAASKILVDGIRGDEPALLLGGNVARAFGFKHGKPFDSFGPIILFPHPSGINRFWNDPRNIRKAKRFLREIFYLQNLPNLL